MSPMGDYVSFTFLRQLRGLMFEAPTKVQLVRPIMSMNPFERLANDIVVGIELSSDQKECFGYKEDTQLPTRSLVQVQST